MSADGTSDTRAVPPAFAAPLEARLRDALADRYEIRGLLGAGGMAVVYEAIDLRHGRRVAIKVIPDANRATLASRFGREIELAARMQHPNVVPLYESGAVGDLVFYVMPRIDGESLRARLDREGRLAIGTSVAIVTDVARALTYAHQHGVVHRDVKPGNIMLTGDVAVVTDFGIARPMDHARNAAITETGLAIGTPTYMSPEQASGAGDLDGRSDVYSLACVAFELLTGQPPFVGSNAQAIVAGHWGGAIPSVTAQNPAFPAAIDTVLRRALAKLSAERYATPDEFAAALALAASPTARLTPSAVVAAVLPRRVRARIAFASVVVLVIAAVGWAVRAKMTRDEAPPMLVVLPFEARGPARDSDFAAGMTDELTTRIASLAGLRVISHASVQQYEFRGKSMSEVGREFGAAYVVTGSITFEHSADGTVHLRVLPNLTSVSSDRAIWSQPQGFEASLRPGELLNVLAQLAEAVATQLNVEIAPEERARGRTLPTQNTDAYKLYLRGLALRERRYDPAATRRAVELFQLAVGTDSTFALAHARLAQTQIFVFRTFDPDPRRIASAREAIARASALDSMLPELRLARATLTYLQPSRSDSALVRDLEFVKRLRPNDTDLLWLQGVLARRQGKWDTAQMTFRRAIQLSPRSELYPIELSGTLFALRQFDDAEEYVIRVQELAPQYPFGQAQLSYLRALQGDSVRARQAVTDGMRRFGARAMLLTYLPFYDRPLPHRLVPALVDTLRALRLGQIPIDSGTFYLAKANLAADEHAPNARTYYDSALAVWSPRAARLPGDADVRMQYAYALAGLGRTREALAAADSAMRLRPLARDAWRGATTIYAAMNVAMRVGEWSRARADAATLLSHYSVFTTDYLRIAPEFAEARRHPEFADLLRRP